MHLIPADIHSKRIIRFTVTSQFTTADDILKDWSIISETASALLAENNSAQTESESIAAKQNQDILADGSEGREEAVSQAGVELWIDKTWTQPSRPTRSLSCSSEPPPEMCDCCCETKPGLRNPAVAAPEPVPELTATPSALLGKQALKKLTKFYSVPSFCNAWVACGRQRLCCPLEVSETQLSSSCRTTNGLSPSPVADSAPTPTQLETATAVKLL